MNPDNFLLEHCCVCDIPVMECKDRKHARIREKQRKLVLEASFIRGRN